MPTGYGEAHVWTGKEVLIWYGGGTKRGSGIAFDVERRSWRALPSYKAGGIDGTAAVWTGREMIVWGGFLSEDGGAANAGASFDPSTNRWSPIPDSPLTPVANHEAVWTGKLMVVWGVGGSTAHPRMEAAAYEPLGRAWKRLDSGPLGVRYQTSAIAIGNRVLVWGGVTGNAQNKRYFRDGAVLDPTKNQWRRIAPSPIAGREWPSVVGTGSSVVVWGGVLNGKLLRDGASYDPASDRWSPLPAAPIEGRRAASIVWTGSRVLIWSGLGVDPSAELEESGRNDGAMFDPRTLSWEVMQPAPLAPRSGSVFLWTGGSAFAWSGCCLEDEVSFRDGALYVP